MSQDIGSPLDQRDAYIEELRNSLSKCNATVESLRGELSVARALAPKADQVIVDMSVIEDLHTETKRAEKASAERDMLAKQYADTRASVLRVADEAEKSGMLVFAQALRDLTTTEG